MQLVSETELFGGRVAASSPHLYWRGYAKLAFRNAVSARLTAPNLKFRLRSRHGLPKDEAVNQEPRLPQLSRHLGPMSERKNIVLTTISSRTPEHQVSNDETLRSNVIVKTD